MERISWQTEKKRMNEWKEKETTIENEEEVYPDK